MAPFSQLICALFCWLSLPFACATAALRRSRRSETAGHVTQTVYDKDELAALSDVPAVAAAGKDGFPKLPVLTQMLSDATGILSKMKVQAQSVQARVIQAQVQASQAQMRMEVQMANKKAAYEDKLKVQEQDNQVLVAANSKASAAIEALKQSNSNLEKATSQIDWSNHAMISQLKNLRSHLRFVNGGNKDKLADDYAKVKKAVNQDSKELQALLHPSKSLLQTSSRMSTKSQKDEDDSTDNEDDDTGDRDPDRDDDASEEEDGDDEDDEKEDDSFLSVSTKRVRRHGAAKTSNAASTGDAATLHAAMRDLASASASMGQLWDREMVQFVQQERIAEKEVEKLFKNSLLAGSTRKAALLKQQSGLSAIRTSLQALQSRLLKVQAHLQATHTHLQKCLDEHLKEAQAQQQGLGMYLKQFQESNSQSLSKP